MSKRPPQINIRVPDKLKEILHDLAESNGRSVNSEIVSRLEKSLESKEDSTGSKLNEAALTLKTVANELHESTLKTQLASQAFFAEKEKISKIKVNLLPAILIGRANRIQGSHSPGNDKERILAVINTVTKIDKINLFVRAGSGNYSALSIAIFCGDYTFLSDCCIMTVERRPREREVLEFFQELELLGLLDAAEFAVTRTKQTRDLPVEKAIEELEQYETKPVRSSIYEFLSLFFSEPDKVKPNWFIEEWEKLN